ncbi:MAG: CHAT domain-containing protein [Planctomycetota bacterium]
MALVAAWKDAADPTAAVAELVRWHDEHRAALPEPVEGPAVDQDLCTGLAASGVDLSHLPAALAAPYGGAEARVRWAEDARAASCGLGAVRLAGASLNLCRVLSELGRVPAVLAAADAALAESAGEVTGYEPYLELERATALRLLGRWDDMRVALERVDRAIDTKRFPPQALVRPSWCGEHVELYLQFGTPRQAALWLEREEAAVRAIPLRYPSLEAGAGLHRADVDLAARRYHEVLERTAAMLDDATLVGSVPGMRAQLELRRGLALLHVDEEGATERGIELLGAAAESGELGTGERVRANLWLAHEHVNAGEREPAGEALARAEEMLGGAASSEQEPPRTAEQRGEVYLRALAAAMRARERELADVAPGVREALASRLRSGAERLITSWADTPLLAGGIGFLNYGGRRLVLEQFVALAVDSGRDVEVEDAFELLLSAQAQGTLARRLEAEPGDLARIRSELLRPGAGMLVLFPGPTRSYLFALDREAFFVEELASFEALRDAQKPLLRSLLTAPRREGRAIHPDDLARAQRAGERLADELLPESVRAKLKGWSEVLLVSMDLEGPLPIEALPVPGLGLLGAERALTHLPSVAVGLALAARAREAAARDGVLLVAAPEHAAVDRASFGGLVDLPFDESDAEVLEDALGDRLSLLSGTDAVADELRAALAEAPEVLHLLCHGVYAPERERPAALVLSGVGAASGLLTCDDVEALAVPPLVFLSSCGSARGPLRLGDDGIAHLGGAFLWAGADTVLLSHAGQDYAASVALSEHLYAALAGGASPSEALRQARAALTDDARFAHPHYYALLRAVGLR